MAEIVNIYTDGSANCQNQLGGWAAVLLLPEGDVELGGAYENTTNNQMEMMAVIEVLEWISKDSLRPFRSYHIFSDSQLVVNGAMEWRHGWATKGWKKVKNADLWKVLDGLLNQLAADDTEVVLRWVEGHAGHEHNERCDKLARAQYNSLKNKQKKNT